METIRMKNPQQRFTQQGYTVYRSFREQRAHRRGAQSWWRTVCVVVGATFSIHAAIPMNAVGQTEQSDAPIQFQPAVLEIPFQLGGASSNDTSAVNIGLAYLLPNIVNSMLAVHPMLNETISDHSLRTLFPSEKSLREWIAGKSPLPKDVIDEDFKERYLLTGSLRLDKNKAPVADLVITDRESGKAQTKTLNVDLPSLLEFQNGVVELLDAAGLSVTAGEKSRMVWKEDLPRPAFDAVCKRYYQAVRLDYNSATTDQLLRASKEAIAAAPKSYVAAVEHARSLQIANYARNMDEAKKQFERAIALHQNGFAAATGLLYIALDQGDEEGVKTWSIRRATMQSKSGDATLGEFYAAQAQAAAAKKNYKKAAELYIKASEFNRVPDYTRKMARMLALAGNVTKAEQILRSEMRDAKTPTERELFKRSIADIWSDRATLFWDNYQNTKESSDLGAAMASYKRSLDEWVNPPIATRYVLAHTYLPTLGDATVADTVQSLSTALSRQSTSKQERLRLAIELARSLDLRAQRLAEPDVNKTELAEKLLRSAVMLDKEDFGHTYFLMDVLIKHSAKYDTAEAVIADGMKTWAADKGKLPLLWNGRGMIAMKKRNYDDAITAYKNAVTLTPDLYSSLEGLGSALVSAKRYAEAIPPLERRVMNDSSSAEAFRFLGVSYFYLKNMTKAKGALLKSFALNAKGNEVPLYLARIHAVQKDYTEAVKFLEVALQNKVASLTEVESDASFEGLRTRSEYSNIRTKYRR